MTMLNKSCPFCGEWTGFDFTDEQVKRYFTRYQHRQEPVQIVFPELSPEEREFLITGMCRECQHEVFGQ